MKAFAILFFAVVVSAEIDWSNVKPITEIEGFWDGRDPELVKAFSLTKFNRRIVNGEIAAPHQFPYQVRGFTQKFVRKFIFSRSSGRSSNNFWHCWHRPVWWIRYQRHSNFNSSALLGWSGHILSDNFWGCEQTKPGSEPTASNSSAKRMDPTSGLHSTNTPQWCGRHSIHIWAFDAQSVRANDRIGAKQRRLVCWRNRSRQRLRTLLGRLVGYQRCCAVHNQNGHHKSLLSHSISNKRNLDHDLRRRHWGIQQRNLQWRQWRTTGGEIQRDFTSDWYRELPFAAGLREKCTRRVCASHILLLVDSWSCSNVDEWIGTPTSADCK